MVALTKSLSEVLARVMAVLPFVEEENSRAAKKAEIWM